ncbi:DNA replication/repair protein RecF [Erysipelatoclostridium ramosum]|uniref:DNA replication/repair protein RecF n=1 Tax=Thomasclavelia ramosa TaxID=1547 RepID=UPI001D08D2E2|nr:DNA replication/repair protein RecF [Thomasclavelia ramosa]MCB6556638.1 DNA replication/repair protein RecF [Thomasclavelia ramosa]
MKVNSLCLDNFRNYNHFFIEFDRDINILIGSNGQGKTNLIEAIYLLSVGKSFKTHINKQMIMFDCEFAKVKGEVTSNNKLRSLEMILGSDFKRAKIDDQDIYKISEYVGLLNVVVFVPDDLYLIKGNPNNRRRFIDLELSKISPIYVFNLSKYNNLLKERNKYLKILNQKNRDGDEYLEVLDEQMARLQVELIKKRIDFIKNLNQKVTSIYNLIAKNDNEKISLRYRCFLKQELTYENILALYKKNHQRDIRYMQSHLGIHKDDLKIFMNGNAADLFASQGQQRTIVLSLKIALIELIKDEIGEYPVLLLDDVLSELDEARKNMLLDILNQKIQTFITTTSIDGINHQIVEKAKKIYIKGGKEAT